MRRNVRFKNFDLCLGSGYMCIYGRPPRWTLHLLRIVPTYLLSGHLWTDPDDVEHQIFKMFDNREEVTQ